MKAPASLATIRLFKARWPSPSYGLVFVHWASDETVEVLRYVSLVGKPSIGTPACLALDPTSEKCRWFNFFMRDLLMFYPQRWHVWLTSQLLIYCSVRFSQLRPWVVGRNDKKQAACCFTGIRVTAWCIYVVLFKIETKLLCQHTQ